MNFVSSITLAFKDAFSSGFNDAKDSLAGMRGALDQINQNQAMNRLAADMAMMTSLTDPARQALSNMMGEPSRLAGRMDASMRNIQSLTGETNESLAKLEQELLSVGGASVAGPNAIADAYYNIASGIGDVTVRMDTLKAATALSESGQADLGAATSGLISVVNAYGTSAENITGLSDVFFQTVRKGVGSLDGFVGAMSSVAGLSASVGIGFDELGAAMAFITAGGQKESVAATQLKAAVISFMKPTSEMAAALESMNISSGSAMIQEYGLAASLDMLKQALGGNQDAMAKALGSTEALQAAIKLTEEGYTTFAKSYGEGLDGATAAGLEAQVLSYEAKVARLQSASDALSIGIGEDINAIKGFFVDIKYGFLSDVVSPLMSSPVGGAISKIAAVAGLGAKSILDMGSGALNTATQLTVLTANISNAGGIAKMFSSSLGLIKSGVGILATPLKVAGTGFSAFSAWVKNAGFLQAFQKGITGLGTGFAQMGKSILGLLPKMGAWIASAWSAAAAHIAAFWPIYAVIGGVALLTAGVIALVKNWSTVSAFFGRLWEGITGIFSAAWDWIKNLIFGTSDWILAAVAVFMPIVGIPALIIKHWDEIKRFFSNLWSNVTTGVKSAWNAMPGFFSNVWSSVTAGTTAAWNAITGFFSNMWEGITGIFSAAWDWIKNLLFGASDWVLGAAALFMPIVGIPALIIKHWDAVKTFFVNLWNDPKAAIMGFIDWIGGKVEALTAPFRVIGDVVGGAFSKVGGLFKSIVGGGEESGAQMNNTFASGIRSNASVPAAAFGNSLQGVARQMPHSDAPEGPLSAITASGHALTETFASGMDGKVLREKTSLVFSQAAPEISQWPDLSGFDIPLEQKAPLAFSIPSQDREALFDRFPAAQAQQKEAGAQTVHIQNLYLQAADCQTIFDFVRMLMHAVERPQEAPA
ncbi:MAG: phage tail tape measure protein [Treponema sp.]|nr:phage tail tape measure protein [Treponema sp.]